MLVSACRVTETGALNRIKVVEATIQTQHRERMNFIGLAATDRNPPRIYAPALSACISFTTPPRRKSDLGLLGGTRRRAFAVLVSLKRTGVYFAAAGALERNAIRSLHPRPLEVGYGPGFDNWIIT